ncbi:MAG: ACT domain-containing protein [Gammaproteobacteria bacterium]|nr:ACT domain-containing protein [Gammaproteobacteria bacterium]MCP4983418.1 ACT domain-containing protein [Gammaproteobacteria bacterium]
MSTISLLKLTVNNHPGVLAHVCGLFARRAYNLEGVMVRPIAGGARRSRMWLLVNEEERLQQLIRQTEKLIDVISVEQHDLEGSIFEQTEAFFV